MAMWLVRGGKFGEHEDRFLGSNQICLTWSDIGEISFSDANGFEEIRTLAKQMMPGQSVSRVGNTAGQWSAFLLGMKMGDLVIMPRKQKRVIALGEIEGEHRYDPKADSWYWHSRAVKWIAIDVPRASFDKDLLFSFGAIMTICEIKRNDAEKRVRALIRSGFTHGAASKSPTIQEPIGAEEDPASRDMEEMARDQIAQRILAKFKGHDMARLVGGILSSQGYRILISPPGPDKGVDILASPEPMGFGHPRICVQVKSTDGPVDSPTFNQLIGTMQNVQAEHGLLVSWGGFKATVRLQEAPNYFKVRLWDQADLIEELLKNYDKLDQDLQAELPLKKIWALADPGETE